MSDFPVWVNGADAARIFGIGWPALRQIILDHDVPHMRIGERWKIKPETLAEHLDRLAELQVRA